MSMGFKTFVTRGMRTGSSGAMLANAAPYEDLVYDFGVEEDVDDDDEKVDVVDVEGVLEIEKVNVVSNRIGYLD